MNNYIIQLLAIIIRNQGILIRAIGCGRKYDDYGTKMIKYAEQLMSEVERDDFAT